MCTKCTKKKYIYGLIWISFVSYQSTKKYNFSVHMYNWKREIERRRETIVNFSINQTGNKVNQKRQSKSHQISNSLTYELIAFHYTSYSQLYWIAFPFLFQTYKVHNLDTYILTFYIMEQGNVLFKLFLRFSSQEDFFLYCILISKEYLTFKFIVLSFLQ